MKKINFSKAINAINKGKQFAIFIHISPDGDCIGSAKAIENLLVSLGKKAYIVCEDKPSFDTEFLADGFYDDEDLVESCDTFICLDISGAKRAGKYENYLKKNDRNIIVIDHHQPQDDFGTIICRDDTASSATELVFNLFEEMKFNITPECATYLYAGIASDTDCFVLPNTKSSTLEAAAKLKALGADTKKANFELFVKRPKDYIKIARLAYKNVKVYGDKLSLVTINNREYKSFDKLNTFYVLDALKFYTTDALVIVTQKDKNTIKVNARSRNYNVQKLCAHFGGGGHINAAGATFEGNFKKTISDVKKIVLENYFE